MNSNPHSQMMMSVGSSGTASPSALSDIIIPSDMDKFKKLFPLLDSKVRTERRLNKFIYSKLQMSSENATTTVVRYTIS